jgi:hypothetical protein
MNNYRVGFEIAKSVKMHFEEFKTRTEARLATASPCALILQKNVRGCWVAQGTCRD